MSIDFSNTVLSQKRRIDIEQERNEVPFSKSFQAQIISREEYIVVWNGKGSTKISSSNSRYSEDVTSAWLRINDSQIV
jgi:valyl-tRNA synthetase